MTSTVNRTGTDPIRAAARAVLVAAVRGRRARGGPWGEAVLAEFGQTTGRWEAVRWTAGGLKAVWQERRAKARTRPRYVRISRRILTTTVVGLLAALVVNQFLLTPRYMLTGSMSPTVRSATATWWTGWVSASPASPAVIWLSSRPRTFRESRRSGG